MTTSISLPLLAWFDTHQRPLPWRITRDPYAIWVSEVMLQQTTVTAVVNYFHRFMAAFPTVEALAEADEQQILRMWEGLGYYRRARHLHAAARHLVSEHDGQLPDDPAIWAALPGVGRYILGAVLSQAFDRRLPIVEANSLRVLARLFGEERDPRISAGKAWVWQTAEELLPRKRVGDHNQALMELGALICTVATPKCGECPLRKVCIAKKLGKQDSIPPKPKAKTITAVREVAVIVRDRSRVLLCQRSPTASRWANMWEVPHGELQAGESDADAAVWIAKELTGLTVAPGAEVMTIRHAVTRYAITMVCVDAKRIAGRFSSKLYAEGRWLKIEELADYPVSSPQRKLMRNI